MKNLMRFGVYFEIILNKNGYFHVEIHINYSCTHMLGGFKGIQYRPSSLSIDPAFRASACTDCEYMECTMAIIIIVILVQSLVLVY